MITVLGESLVDVVRSADGRVRRHPGGSPANVAVGLARLGHGVRLRTAFGDDADGALLAAAFERDGVQVLRAVTAATSTATAHLDATGAAGYEFSLLPDPDPQLPAELGECLHTGSLAALVPAAAERSAALLRAARGRAAVSFDPNCRPALMGEPADVRARVAEHVAASDVVKASAEDVAWLHPGEDVRAVARRWAGLGPALVVVTDGGAGCTAVAAAGEVAVPALPVAVADTVGAGDSFTSALLDALSRRGALGADSRERIARLDAAEIADVL
ncbi:PfkB family carbohydrate kinase, partial [Kineococcus glutinatus]|uniref:PfkB family carbohydrate kinase n=1 Tax=Kineococcus glutinatus TaxID=1070872 RepID=UPI0031ECCF58